MDTELHKGQRYVDSDSAMPERLILHSNDALSLHCGEFRVLKLLGKGGFGSVYQIESIKDNQLYALKTMNLWEMQPTEFDFLKEKFKQGFKAGRLKSPNVVTSHNLGSILGNPYIIMEYCAHGNLESQMHAFSEESQVDTLAIQVLSGLEALHNNGIIHRDLKPANILFGDKQVAKLSDFDLSGHLDKRTTYKSLLGYAKAVYGTIAFCPPEQMDAGKYYQLTKPSMDLYAFGSTMYYVLSNGRNPYGEFSADLKDINRYQEKKRNEKPIPITQFNPTVSTRWRRLLEKCLEPNPKKRVQTVAEAIALLELDRIPSNAVSNVPAGHAILTVLIGEDMGKVFSLEEIAGKQRSTLIKIGRESEGQNQIDLTEKYTQYISRKHCVIEKTNSMWVLRDGQYCRDNKDGHWQHSTNGTSVNFKNIENGSYHILKNGDLIMVGDYRLKFNI